MTRFALKSSYHVPVDADWRAGVPRSTLGNAHDMQMVTEKRQSLRVAVDRRAGKLLVLRDDSGKIYDVPAAVLPQPCRNTGTHLEVPLDGSTPRWSGAKQIKH